MLLEQLQSFNVQNDELFNIVKIFGTIVIVIIVMVLLLRSVNRVSDVLSKNATFSPPLIVILRNVTRWVVFISFTLIIFQQIGIRINSIWTLISAIAAMVAIGFVAVWSILSNLLCALLLIVLKPFQIGDHIELVDPAMTSGIKGYVKSINLFFTTLTETQENGSSQWKTHVPNNLFFQKVIRCHSGNSTPAPENHSNI